jgi:hypothetical protein
MGGHWIHVDKTNYPTLVADLHTPPLICFKNNKDVNEGYNNYKANTY